MVEFNSGLPDRKQRILYVKESFNSKENFLKYLSASFIFIFLLACMYVWLLVYSPADPITVHCLVTKVTALTTLFVLFGAKKKKKNCYHHHSLSHSLIFIVIYRQRDRPAEPKRPKTYTKRDRDYNHIHITHPPTWRYCVTSTVVARPPHNKPPKRASLTAALSPPLLLWVPPAVAQNPSLFPRYPRVQRPLPPRQSLPPFCQPLFKLCCRLTLSRSKSSKPLCLWRLPWPRPFLDPLRRCRSGTPSTSTATATATATEILNFRWL